MAVRVGLRLARKIKSGDIGGKGALGGKKNLELATEVARDLTRVIAFVFGHFHVNGCAGAL